jgi:hypothetical protein
LAVDGWSEVRGGPPEFYVTGALVKRLERKSMKDMKGMKKGNGNGK